MEKKRNIYRIFLGKPEGKKPLGRSRRRWVVRREREDDVVCGSK
jgi:hypothetical protein